MRFIGIVVLSLVMYGCCSTQWSSTAEVESAELANTILTLRQELEITKEASLDATEFDEDREVLSDLYKVLDKDMKNAHELAIKLYQRLKSERDDDG